MGPSSGDDGNTSKSVIQYPTDLLQWGRRLVTTEMPFPTPTCRSALRRCFNGAVVW